MFRRLTSTFSGKTKRNLKIYKDLCHAINEKVGIQEIKKLIASGYDINRECLEIYKTPLEFSIIKDEPDIFKELIKSGANINYVRRNNSVLRQALEKYIIDNKPVYFEVLIDNNVNVNQVIEGEVFDSTPLLQVLKLYKSNPTNAHNAIEKLIKAGVDINKITLGSIPLSEAILKRINLPTIKMLVKSGADINYINSIGETILYIAASYGNKEALEYLLKLPTINKNQRIKGKTIYEYAIRNGFNDEINKLIIEFWNQPVRKELWKGLTRSDIEKLDSIFSDHVDDYSFCPVCLEYVARSGGCLYMYHNCSSSGKYYNQELYNRYNQNGKIEWCTVCGRISNGHKHYKLSSASTTKLQFVKVKNEETMNIFFEDDCRKSSGGGGPPEKLARFHRLREVALELQNQINKISHDQAMNKLVVEVWNAPLSPPNSLTNIARNKKWNIPIELFRENKKTDNNLDISLVNIKRPVINIGLEPKLLNAGTNFMGEEGPLIQFQHRQPDGTIYKHKDSLITKESLDIFLGQKLKEFGTEEFGYCYMYPGKCKARLYPEEIKEFVSEDIYNTYREKFNKKFQKGGRRKTKKVRISLGGKSNIFVEALNALCVLPKNTRRNPRHQ